MHMVGNAANEFPATVGDGHAALAANICFRCRGGVQQWEKPVDEGLNLLHCPNGIGENNADAVSGKFQFLDPELPGYVAAVQRCLELLQLNGVREFRCDHQLLDVTTFRQGSGVTTQAAVAHALIHLHPIFPGQFF